MFGATNVASATNFPAKGKQSGLIDALERVGGLTFYADYSKGDINALYAKGSPTATFTATRAGTGTDATYTNTAGIVAYQAKVNNTPRISYAWYDTAGLHVGNKGLMIESATVNGLTFSYNLPNAAWTKVDCTITTDAINMVGLIRSIITADATSATVLQAWASGISTYHAASAYIQRIVGSGNIYLRASTAQPWDLIPITTSIARWASTSTSLTPEFQLMLNTSGDVIRVTGVQLENNPYPTSYIPSDAVIASRGLENLTYKVAKNNPEITSGCTLFVSCVFNGGKNWQLGAFNKHGSTNDRIYFYKGTNSDNISMMIGASGNTRVGTSGIGYYATKEVICFTGDGATAKLYKNGVQEGADLSYTPQATDTPTFAIGKDPSALGTSLVVQNVVMFQRALSAGEVLTVTNLLNGNV